jgi:hypothetical protein
MVISIDKNGYLETVLNLYSLFKVMDNNSTDINKTYNNAEENSWYREDNKIAITRISIL